MAVSRGGVAADHGHLLLADAAGGAVGYASVSEVTAADGCELPPWITS
jgi:hypothetical protein